MYDNDDGPYPFNFYNEDDTEMLEEVKRDRKQQEDDIKMLKEEGF